MATSLRRQLVALAALIVAAAAAASGQAPTAPRLYDGGVAANIPRAHGGGEVVLELTIDSAGAVSQVNRVRLTPPYLDFVVTTVERWRFTPATATADGRVGAVAAPVLVVAVFRPP
ncbi:MAG TPA: hypothetical protein VFZ31_15880, partial [Vicinamibacterales bacterium]